MRYLIVIGFVLSCFLQSFSQPVFTEVSQQVGVNHVAVRCDFEMAAQGGAAWFDYDQDGNYDLYLTGGAQSDILLRNNGNGTFSDVTSSAGIAVLGNVNTDGVTTGDINNDGFPEVFVTTFRSDVNHLFLNNANGTFSELVNWEGQHDTANSFSCSFGDLNLDGFLDLYVCNWSRYQEVIIDGSNVYVDSEANFYYQNNGDGTFSERALALEIGDTLGCGLGVLITDFDNDQDPDLFVANDFGFFPGNSPNRLFQNNYPLESFTEVSVQENLDLEMNGMGVAKTDVNGDGQMDYYITNLKNDKFMVSSITGYADELIDRGLKNDSVWTLDLQHRKMKAGWGVAFFDFDNDMDEDLMVANGDLFYDYPNPALDSNKCYVNDGNGQFTDMSEQLGLADTYVSRALAYCDYDSDGDLDVFIGVTDTVNGVSHSFLYRNDSPEMNWIQVKPTGVQNNRDGVGAKIIVYVDGVKQIREVGGESSFNSQHWMVAHFGLGSHLVADSVEVIWPGGGVDKYYNLPAGQRIEAVEGLGLVTSISELKTISVYPNPFTEQIIVSGLDKPCNLELFDGLGQSIWSRMNQTGSKIVVNSQNLASGNYFLSLKFGDGSQVIRKLIKR